MLKFLVRRLGLLALTLIGISAMIFIIIQILPGDAADQILEAWVETEGGAHDILRAQLGLDRPWYEQYFGWLWDIAHGASGISSTRDGQYFTRCRRHGYQGAKTGGRQKGTPNKITMASMTITAVIIHLMRVLRAQIARSVKALMEIQIAPPAWCRPSSTSAHLTSSPICWRPCRATGSSR